MKLHTMFLRTKCVLPAELKLTQTRFNDAWISAEEITSATLDLLVRRHGWHFMWIEAASSGFGFGRTEGAAANNAITRALHRTSGKYNASELVSLRASRHFGFRFARVTMHARQIQEQTALSAMDRTALRPISLG